MATVKLLDFWAPWCGPCKIMNPIIEELEKELGSKITVEKINVDEDPETASKYGVMSIPTYVVLKGDNLWTISVRAYGDGYQWTKIAQANNLTDPSLIHSGNVLKIPRG